MRDELSVLAGGVAGTAGIFVVLLAGDALTGYRAQVFADLASFVGTPGSPSVGLLLFAGIGVFAWPLLFLSVSEYFPGIVAFVPICTLVTQIDVSNVSTPIVTRGS